MNEPLYPVTVKLIGADGNAFAIISKVSKALRDAGYKNVAEEFMVEAMDGDYNHVLQTVMKYVEVK